MSRIQEKSPLTTPEVKYAPSEEINLNKEPIRLLQLFQQNVFDANESLRQFSCKTERKQRSFV